MRTLAHECLVVPVACSASRFSKQCSSRAAANLWFWDQKCQQHWPKTSVLAFLCGSVCHLPVPVSVSVPVPGESGWVWGLAGAGGATRN